MHLEVGMVRIGHKFRYHPAVKFIILAVSAMWVLPAASILHGQLVMALFEFVLEMAGGAITAGALVFSGLLG